MLHTKAKSVQSRAKACDLSDPVSALLLLYFPLLLLGDLVFGLSVKCSEFLHTVRKVELTTLSLFCTV